MKEEYLVFETLDKELLKEVAGVCIDKEIRFKIGRYFIYVFINNKIFYQAYLKKIDNERNEEYILPLSDLLKKLQEL